MKSNLRYGSLIKNNLTMNNVIDSAQEPLIKIWVIIEY